MPPPIRHQPTQRDYTCAIYIYHANIANEENNLVFQLEPRANWHPHPNHKFKTCIISRDTTFFLFRTNSSTTEFWDLLFLTSVLTTPSSHFWKVVKSVYFIDAHRPPSVRNTYARNLFLHAQACLELKAYHTAAYLCAYISRVKTPLSISLALLCYRYDSYTDFLVIYHAFWLVIPGQVFVCVCVSVRVP